MTAHYPLTVKGWPGSWNIPGKAHVSNGSTSNNVRQGDVRERERRQRQERAKTAEAGIGAAIGTLPFLGAAYEDASGKVDIHTTISWEILAASVGVLILVGVLSGLVPAIRAARLDPVEALRYE